MTLKAHYYFGLSPSSSTQLKHSFRKSTVIPSSESCLFVVPFRKSYYQLCAAWLRMAVSKGTSTVGAFTDTEHLRMEVKPASETSYLNCTLEHCFTTSGPQDNVRHSEGNRGIHK